MFRSLAIGISILTLALPSAANAQQKVKIGVIATLSGPAAGIGQQIRNGFELGIKELNGKVGGRDVDLVVQDDEVKPDVAVTKVRAMVERDKVDFVVGPVFSSVLQAIIKPVTESGTILISPNPGTSDFAGKQCNPNFFVTSVQNDQLTESLGKYANDKGIKRILAIVPNYQAGRDMVGGFKRIYTGQLIDEIYVPINQLDYSAELARIASEKPPAIFAFLPGGMGVNFIKQYSQAGLSSIPLLTYATADEVTLPGQRDAALGVLASATYAPNFDSPRNKKFVAAYEKDFNSVPGSYAAQAYDAAFLIDAALKETKGNTSDKVALRTALMKANFESVRGKFKFNINHYPIQDFYLTKVAKRPDGKFQTEVVEKIISDYADHYVGDCSMK